MKNTLIPLLLGTMALNPPLYAQEAIQIEIDSAPVEIQIEQPAPAQQEEEPVQQTVEAPEPEAPPVEEAGGFGAIGIAIGVVVAGALAALAGGGGGSGGGASTTPSHP